MIPLICWFILVSSAKSHPVRYDQRQTGDVNVQIDLKDVKVIALVKSDLLDDYMNYDYVYDYADFTLKPITKPTTKSPLTSANNSLESTTVFSSMKPVTENSSNYLESTTSSLITEDLVLTTVDVSVLETSTKLSSITEKITPVLNDDLEDLPEKIISTPQGSVENSVRNRKPAKRCKDKSGRCLRRRISFLPLAMRIAPELIRSVRKQIV